MFSSSFCNAVVIAGVYIILLDLAFPFIESSSVLIRLVVLGKWEFNTFALHKRLVISSTVWGIFSSYGLKFLMSAIDFPL